MKTWFKIFFLAILCVACSDFFPRDQVKDGGGGQQKTIGLPDKAEIDPKACSYGTLDSNDLRERFVWTMSTQWVCPKVSEFRYDVTLLRLASDLLCVENAPSTVEDDLQRNFYTTLNVFEKLAANPYGPLRADSNKLGMEIYSYPNNNRFALNAEYLKANDQGEGYEMRLAPSRKGLSAIENLIFNREAILKPRANGKLSPKESAFNALPIEKRAQARCLVLRSMVNDLAARAEDLYLQWSNHGQAYPRQLLTRMKSGETQMILNEISDGMIYIERVKDYKLGLPLGLNSRCLADKCPEEVENAASGASIQSLIANQEGLKAAFLGFKGPGFRDLLVAVGKEPLATRMADVLQRMDESLKEMTQQRSLSEQVASTEKATCVDANSALAVCRMYYQATDFLNLFKSDFLSALNLQPPRTDADND
jgi:hypothetical protein